jgi:hypothetical protein
LNFRKRYGKSSGSIFGDDSPKEKIMIPEPKKFNPFEKASISTMNRQVKQASYLVGATKVTSDRSIENFENLNFNKKPPANLNFSKKASPKTAKNTSPLPPPTVKPKTNTHTNFNHPP